MHYGIGVEQFEDLFPALLRQKLHFQNTMDLSSEDRYDHQAAAAAILLTESIIAQRGAVQREHASALIRPIIACVRKWSYQWVRSHDDDGHQRTGSSSCILLAAAIHASATYYCRSRIDDQLHQSILHLLRSAPAMKQAASTLIRSSNLCLREKIYVRDAECLPCVNAVLGHGIPVPVLHDPQIIPLLAAVFRIARIIQITMTECQRQV